VTTVPITTIPKERTGGPYVGLRPFTSAERELFFGRDREARDVATIWQATGLTVLFGASGVGKTSLLNAGVVPRIDPERADLLPVARPAPRPGTPPPGANRYVLELLSAWAPDRPPATLARMTISEFLRTRPVRRDRYGDPIPVLAAIDQAEELFSSPVQWKAERIACLEQLAEAAREHDGLHLLLSLREEYLAAVLPYERRLGPGSRARFHLQPFAREAALEAVTGPLRHTDRSFGPGAAEVLVDDLCTVTFVNDEGRRTRLVVDEVEPVQLQVVCSALWDALPPEVTTITIDHVRAYADVDRFLVGFCRRALQEVATEHGITVGELRHWLSSHFVTEHGTRSVVNEGLHETAGMPNTVARALEDRHVLRAEYRINSRWYELQHDRLISAIRRPESPEASLDQARRALKEGRWDVARELADAAARMAEIDDTWVQAEVQAILGEVDAALGDVKSAERRYDEAIATFVLRQQFDKVAEVLTAKGRLRLAQGEYAAAVELLKSALTWASGDVSVQHALGQALWLSGQPHAALACLNGAVERADEPDADALALRGEILADLGRARDALRDLTRVHSRLRPETLAARALAFALTGRLDAAEQEALHAVDSIDQSGGPAGPVGGPDGRGPALLRAARTHALLGDPALAADLARKALEMPGLPPHLRRQAEELVTRRA
jgi:tetratricopeptide (TPR) repeat protein